MSFRSKKIKELLFDFEGILIHFNAILSGAKA
jgi:hypothetical protein